MSRPFLASTLATILAVQLGAARSARAAGGDVATAQVLFDEGRRRMAQHDYAGACPKLEESQRLSPAVGTEFNLADCWEHVGKLASAWAAFLDVADQTHRRGEAERERAARDRAGSLEPRLARISIDVPRPHRIASLEVQRDGQTVRDALWGVGVPVDAGDHRIEARAPGRRAWASVVQATDGQTTAVSIPSLPEAPAPPTPPPSPPAPHEPAIEPPPPPIVPPPVVHTSRDHTAALVVLGGSVVLAGVGIVGFIEHDLNVQSYNRDSSCLGVGIPNQPAHCDSLVSTASTWMTVGVVGVVAGGLALATGVVLWIVAPEVRTTTALGCNPGLGSIACGGSF